MNGKAIRVKLIKNGKKERVIRKMLTEDTVVVPIDLGQIAEMLREGNEVRLGTGESGIRLFPLLDAKCEKVSVIAQTFGDFRHVLDNAKWEVAEDSGATVEEARKLREKAAKIMRDSRKLACVTPDKMIVCPECGKNFRVGKVLSSIK